MPPSSIARREHDWAADVTVPVDAAPASPMKNIRDDPDHAEYLRRWSATYERSN
jgi:hypothetical protein